LEKSRAKAKNISLCDIVQMSDVSLGMKRNVQRPRPRESSYLTTDTDNTININIERYTCNGNFKNSTIVYSNIYFKKEKQQNRRWTIK